MSTTTITNAMKKVASGLPAQVTPSSGQQIMLFGADGTPNGKLSATEITDTFEDCAYLGDNDGQSVIADFDPQSDTLWKKTQVLSNAEKATVKNNLGITQDLEQMNQRLNAQDAAVAQLDGHALVIVDTLPTDESPAVTPDPDVIYRLYVDDGQGNVSYEDYMYNSADLTTPVKIATYALPGVDEVPTSGSEKLVKSGGVQGELALGAVYDVSAHNNNTTFASLEALLSDNNLNLLIPTSVRKGGMSIKFIQSSDNNYVQYRYMLPYGGNTTTENNKFVNPANWQGVDVKPTLNSKNLAESGGVAEFVLDYAKNGYAFNSTENVTSGTNFRAVFGITLPANTSIIIKYNSDSSLFTNDLVNLYIYNDSTKIIDDTFKQNKEKTIVLQSNITRIILERSANGVVGSGELTFNLTVIDRVYENTKDIEALQASVSDLEEDVPQLSNDIDTLEGEYTLLDESVGQIIGRIGGLSERIPVEATQLTGYYYKVESGSFGLVSDSTSKYYTPIDLRNYLGKKVNIKFTGGSSSSSRRTGMGSESGVAIASSLEKNIVQGGGTVTFDILQGYEYLYVSASSSVTTIAITVINEIEDKLASPPSYVATNGSDINGDGTVNNPFATVNKALQSGAKKVIVKPGVYNQTIDIGQTASSNIEICAFDHTKVIFKPTTDYVLSEVQGVIVPNTTKVYSLSVSVGSHKWIFQENVNDASTLISNNERHPLYRGKEYRCECTRIVKCTSSEVADAISEIESSSEYKWFYDSNNSILYYSSPVAVDSSHALCQPVSGASLLSNTGRRTDLKLIGIDSWYQSIVLHSTFAELYFCSAKYVNNEGAFSITGGAHATLVNCEAAMACYGENIGDGINAIGTSANDNFGANTTVRLIDCWSHDNNDDGYSGHQNTESVVNGGLFEYNRRKGGITPSYGEHCVCYNVLSRNNNDGFRYTGAARDNGKYGQLIAFQCIAENNVRAGYSVSEDYNSVKLVNCISKNNTKGYYNANANAILEAIDCKTLNDTTPKDGNYVTVINCSDLQ